MILPLALDARWAMFFDSLRITWIYNTTSFHLEDTSHTPEFFLPDFGLWVSVEQTEFEEPVRQKCKALWEDRGQANVLLVGEPGNHKGHIWCSDLCDSSGGLFDCECRLVTHPERGPHIVVLNKRERTFYATQEFRRRLDMVFYLGQVAELE